MCHIRAQDPSLHGQNNIGGLDYERCVGKGLQILLAARGVIGQTLAMGHLTSIPVRDGRYIILYRAYGRSPHEHVGEEGSPHVCR